MKNIINKVLITLDVADKTALLILLSRDGTIHRKGNGNANETTLKLKQDYSPDGHFEALLMTIDESIFNHTGVVKMPDRLGRECVLTIVFDNFRGEDFSFRVVYGEDSQGPPRELVEILINAVKLTEAWYSAPEPSEKAWWQFWK